MQVVTRRPSQTELAVLGALSLGPMSGYRVRAEILSTLGHFWTESFGQIYPALARLEAGGSVGRDDDGRFTLTRSGRERLRELLRTTPEREPPRNGVLLRLFFGRELGPDRCAAILDELERDATVRLAGLAEIRARLDPDDADGRYQLVTLSAGEHSARATLAWIAETRAALSG